MLSLSDIRTSLPASFLPVALIVLVVLVNLSFVVTALLPRWQTYEQMNAQVAANRDVLEVRAAEQVSDDLSAVFQAQVSAAEDDRNQVALWLLTPGEADGFIERLYQHARTHHIEITNLQAQQTTQMAETGVYELRTFRLQAEGDAHDLMDAIADMEALAVPGVAMDEISIVHNPGGVLLMTLSIYASPYGAGKLDDALPRLTGESVLVPPTPAAPVEILAAGQADVEMTAEPVDCPGAQPSPFHAGDTVVVDFSSVGALRILERASGVDTLTQVYDGTSLRLLDGPVCGTWHGEKILYWHVDYNGLQGWAGEGDSQDRWMCALANPDCS